MNNKLTAGIFLLMMLAVMSCKKNGDEAATPNKKPVPVEHGALTGTPTSKVIGPSGGVIQTPDGNIRIEVPAGAVSTDINFSIQPVSHTLEAATGTAYRLKPENVDFQKDVRVSFQYTDEDVSGTTDNDLYLAYQDAEGYWRRVILTDIDKTSKRLIASTRHFSDWAIERIFYLKNVDKKTRLSANEEISLVAYMSDVDSGNVILSKEIVPTKNIDGWFVNGPGKINFPKSNAVVYTAPASIPEPKEIAVGVKIKNLVDKRHPERPGNAGVVIMQVPLQLLPEEYFIWEMDGTTNIALALDGALLGSTTSIIGTGLTGSVSIWLNATKAGSFDLGSAVTPDKFSIQVSVSGGTAVIYQGTYYNCNESTPRYGSGKLNISNYGSVNGMISGDFSATVYVRESDCKNKSKLVTGKFNIKRKA